MIILSAVLVASAVWLLVPADPQPRVAGMLPGGPTRSGRTSRPAVAAAAAVSAAVGALLLVGGAGGVVLGAVCVVVVPAVIRRLEPRDSRLRRGRLIAQAPVVADLLASTMAAGSPMSPALDAVAQAVGDPARAELASVVAALGLGADSASAWQAVGECEPLSPIATAVIRSSESGAPLSSVLTRIAEDLRREHQVAVQVAARAAGVKAVLPLATCFLPAFVLLGVVPVVVALAGGILA